MSARIISGGKELKKLIDNLGKKHPVLVVGFLKGRKRSDSNITNAEVAYFNEYGATIQIPEHTTTLYRELNSTGDGFNKNGRFVKKNKSNFSEDVNVKATEINIPPRPFMRKAVKENSKKWVAIYEKEIIKSNFNIKKTATMTGEIMTGDIKESITDLKSPPNSGSTKKNKKSSNPLIDTGEMRNAVSFEMINNLEE